MVGSAGRSDFGPGAPLRYGVRVRTAAVLFGFGLALQLLFGWATADHAAAWGVGFQGDAPLWQELAQKLANGQPDELLRLPLRPPGMQWLIASLWNGDPATAWRLRALFAVLGAATAPLVWLLLRRHLEPAAAALAAGLCAASTNLLLLGSGLHVEQPYLVLLLAALLVHERLAASGGIAPAVGCGLLNAALCLLRAEHVLLFALWLVVLFWQRAPHWRRTALTALFAFAAGLAPWQRIAWAQVDAYNTDGAPQLPPPGQAMPGGLPWDEGALTALRQLPAFQQVPTYQFVTDTVRVRGGRAVAAGDLAIVREAYGCFPEPLPKPFVCLYGGLNFFLGNSAEANGGFSQAALDRPPPLTGGDARYPPGLRQVLPRGGKLALSYPPHLDLVVHGYRRGLAELGGDLGGAVSRGAAKLWYGIEGAAGGVGGYALPIGLSGLRRPVDLVTATGAWAATFRTIWLAIAIAGLWTLRRERFAWPWFAMAAVRLAIVVAFFGYARQGALCVPIVSLGIGAAFQAWLLPRWPALARPRVGIALLLVLLVVEGVRARGVEVQIDGAPFAANPVPAAVAEHGAHAIAFR